MERVGLIVSVVLFAFVGISPGASQVVFNSTYGGADVLGLVGAAVNFSWTFTGDARIIKWGTKQTNNDAIEHVLVSLTTGGPSPITPPAQYVGRVSGSWDGKTAPGHVVFTLTSIKKEDDKFYVCQVEPSVLVQTTVRDNLHLVVRVSPVISRVSLNASYNEGSQVSISCLATGTPNPDVTWLRNEQVKITGKNSAVLTFNSINRADDGQYTCKANNSAGSKEEQIILVVHYPATVVKSSPLATKSWIGQTMKLNCETDGVPTPNVTWFNPDGNKLERGTAVENTVDVIMAKDGDFGDYKCIADNGLPPADTVTFTVQQIKKPGAPVITSSDTDIQATSLTVNWREPTDNGGSPITAYRVVILRTGIEIRNENITDPSTTSLSVGGLDKDTKYTVKVFARNFVFEGPAGSKTVQTRHEDRPEGTTLTTSVTGNAAVQGDSVSFTCRVTGANPAVSVYRIYFNDSNTPVTEPTDGRYTINNVQRSQHHGRYKCIPHNDVGDGPQATVDLNINVPSQFVRLPQNQTVNETDPVLIRCKASGYPAPNTTWTKDGKPLAVSDEIVNITQSKRTDTGRYVCKADNGAGPPQTAAAYVLVQYPATVIRYSPTNIKSWIGQTVKLKCVSDGTPTPTVTWFKPDGNELQRVKAKENTVDVNMVGNEDFGDYKCIADNGLSPAGTVTVTVQQIKKPGAPVITSSDADIGATSVTVNWSEPTDDGGSPITAYRVVILRTRTEIKNENITDPRTTSLSVGGLDRDTQHTVKVFARNFVFEGPARSKTVQTRYEGVPYAAELIDVPSEVQGDKSTLKWNEPPNNGVEITQYTVYKRTVNEDGTTGDWEKVAVINDPSIREYTIQLNEGNEYDIVVTATNIFGEGLREEGKIKRIKVIPGSDGAQKNTQEKQTGATYKTQITNLHAIYLAVIAFLLLVIIILFVILWRIRRSPVILPTTDQSKAVAERTQEVRETTSEVGEQDLGR